MTPTATTNDLFARLRQSDAVRIAVAVNVGVNPQSNNPFRDGNVRPEGLEPSTDRISTGCIPTCHLVMTLRVRTLAVANTSLHESLHAD